MPDTTAAWARSSVFDDILYQFEKDYRAGKNPEPEAYLTGEGENRWRLLLELLHSNLELRLRAGEKLCVKDYLLKYPELAQRPGDILSLLAVELRHLHEQGQKPKLEDYEHEYGKLLPSSLKPLFEQPSPKQTDHNIGKLIANRYRLINVLGQGGMGTVYLAEQSEPVKRQVALKLIKAGIDSRSYITRFEAERQALAVMDHPNIARVYDGGTTELQQPYFVMELVQGIPITQYCDQRRLNPKARLELFVLICQAVQHAHQKGIIHRDLKPGNVLVTVVDGKPVPKVIDFGLAKATEQPLTDETIEVQGIVGTPAYMSPEQADPGNTDVDTRTDVYALGVILYELLTGSTPIDAKQFRRGAMFEMLRMVREVDPPRPCTKLSSTDELPNIAANRDVEPKQLLAWVRGDIEWIVMKSLEKDRNQRYETANGFASDVQRYLSGEPVLAHPTSRWYRVKKFVRRNRMQVVAAGLVLVTLVAGIIGTTVGYYNAEHAAEKEMAARLDEERERKYAQAIASFVKDDFLALTSVEGQEHAGDETLDRESSLLDLLNRAGSKLEKRKGIEPRMEAELCWIIGVSYRGVGEADKGISFLERAVELRRGTLGPDHIDTMIALNSLAMSYHESGNYEQALPLFEATFKRRKARLGPDHPNTLVSMNNLAMGYLDVGQVIRALAMYEECYALRKAKLGPTHPNTLASMNNLGEGYKAVDQLDKALPLLEETLKLCKANLGQTHSRTLRTLSNLVGAYRTSGQIDRALPLLKETLELTKAKLGPNHHDTLISMNILGDSYREAGKLDLAIPLLDETLKLRKVKFGHNHPHTLNSMNNLAVAYRTASQIDKALPLFEETLTLSKAKLGLNHPDTFSSMCHLADIYQDAGKLDRAVLLHQEAFTLRKTKLGPNHRDTLVSMNNLAACYWTMRQLDKSIPLFEELLPLKEKKFGRGHKDTQRTVANLGVNYKDARRFADAIPLLEEVFRASKKYPNLRWIEHQLLDAYVKSGNLVETTKLLDELIADARKTYPKDSPNLVGRLIQFSMTQIELRNFSEAETLLRESLLSREKSQPDAWNTFNTHSMLGIALLGQKNYTEGEQHLLKGYNGMKAREKSIPKEATSRLTEALDSLIQLYTETNNPDEVKKWQAEKAKLSELRNVSTSPKNN